MKLTKSPEALAALFDEVAPSKAPVERRKMFGYPCAFVNGNMFTGLHRSNMIIRLRESDRANFLALPGAALFEPMPGRPMKEYVVVPDRILNARAELGGWMKKSLGYALDLPPKAKGDRKVAGVSKQTLRAPSAAARAAKPAKKAAAPAAKRPSAKHGPAKRAAAKRAPAAKAKKAR